MKRSEWNDKQLEELLSNMPKIQDHRDPRDIYQNITIKMSKKKQRSWVVPSVATAAAILLFVILVPNVMNWNESTSNSMEERSTASDSAEQPEMAKMTENSEDSAGGKEEAKIFTDKKNDENMQMTSIEEEETYTALYKEDLTDGNVFTYAIPDTQGQNIVPISIVVPKEDGKELFEQYKEIMTSLKEEEWGLSEFYPLKAELSISNESVLNVSVPTDHPYMYGVPGQEAFTETLRELAKTLGLNEVDLFTEEKKGIEFELYGNLPTLDLSNDSNHAYYFHYPEKKPKQLYLVPYSQPYKSIEEAFNAMKENISLGLSASIPQDINIEEIKSAGEDILNLKFDDDSKIANEPSFIHTIEAILLTAKDFDFEKVIIQYNKLDKIGKFNMNEEIEVPVAPNKMEILN
ncbi:hypothetical protein [Robertmurraya kyonggiensis]|uniref:Uncharacterized protein n=1 Tax=Robertmurraya kyonggiensis TaxID=1037680 RepID=A0A4V6WNF0_9BACI|nr:hypothetical protein [Robertmurraya kyonggiensis]TKC19760.1 hypothetical protein FA727_09565 [Robertmurraya kyonggiensis]